MPSPKLNLVLNKFDIDVSFIIYQHRDGAGG